MHFDRSFYIEERFCRRYCLVLPED